MKLALLFVILTLSSFNTIYATEADNSSNDYAFYCDEQAQLAGIEETTEKNEYIKDCIESFGMPTDNTTPQDNG